MKIISQNSLLTFNTQKNSFSAPALFGNIFFLTKMILSFALLFLTSLAAADGGGGGLRLAVFVSYTNLPTIVDECTAFTSTVTVRNAGDYDWTAAGGYSLRILNNSWGTTTVNIPSGVTVSRRIYSGISGTYTYSDYGFVGTFTAPCTPGSYAFQAQMYDSSGAIVVASTQISITVNGRPTASSANVSVNKNASANIVLGASDPDNNALTYTVLSQPSHGMLTGSGANRTYTPTAGYYGSDSFTFNVSDGRLTSTTATISITVVNTNVAPVAANQDINVNYQTANALTLSATDANGDALTYIVTLNPIHGTLTGSAPNLTYTPANGYSGPDSIAFKANDGALDSTVGVVTITVGANPNVPPIASNQSVNVDYNSSAEITLSATDANDDALSFSIVGFPEHGSISGLAPNITYTPVTGYSGPDTIVFKANDGEDDSNLATVTITVAEKPNVAPVADAQSIEVPFDTETPIVLSAVDPDDYALSFVLVEQPAHGTLNGTPPELTYTPEEGYSGPDSFTFTAADALVTSDAATISINVLPKPNAAPVAMPQTVSVQYESEAPIIVSGDDEDGDELTLSIVSFPQNGTLTGSPPNFTYTPHAGFSGEDSFTFSVNDGELDSETALVMITVSDPPFPGITTPTQITLPGEATQIFAGGFAGDATTCGLMSNGDFYCWGANNTQQCGINASGLKVEHPILIPDATAVSSAATSGNHTCVIVHDSQIKCFGSNTYGQLGDKSTASSTTLKKVLGLY